MASIRKINAKWEARVRIRGFPTSCKSFTPKSDAVRWAKQIEVGLQIGQAPQATPNSSVGSQSFTSKDISNIRNDYLQKQSELQPIKPQSPL